MKKTVKLLLMSEKGEGPVTGTIWYGVAAVVGGAISVAIWATLSNAAGSIKTLITTTIH